jgi:hypothetical protein
MLDCMRTVLVGTLIVLALVVLVAELALLPYLEHRVEDRLEEGGGAAEVEIDAFPALGLLVGRAGSFRGTGSRLRFEILDGRRESPFERLDDFKSVDMQFREIEAGPLRVNQFELTRFNRHDPYKLKVTATTTPRELSAELGGAAAGTLGGLIGSLSTGLLPGAGDLPIPVELDAIVDSRDGKPNVTSARGSVAGLPAGPLANVVLASVLERL